NGAYPVAAFTAELMANSVTGTFSSQSTWSGRTNERRTCTKVRIFRSVTPSVCG
ncbi:hypothetical protein PENSPDRAFT_549857, partial [Peniophora sp. CONT]